VRVRLVGTLARFLKSSGTAAGKTVRRAWTSHVASPQFRFRVNRGVLPNAISAQWIGQIGIKHRVGQSLTKQAVPSLKSVEELSFPPLRRPQIMGGKICPSGLKKAYRPYFLPFFKIFFGETPRTRGPQILAEEHFSYFIFLAS
jgi:hypothetical protein